MGEGVYLWFFVGASSQQSSSYVSRHRSGCGADTGTDRGDTTDDGTTLTREERRARMHNRRDRLLGSKGVYHETDQHQWVSIVKIGSIKSKFINNFRMSRGYYDETQLT